MEATKSEVTYPPGHNWEGLTPSQVNEGYVRHGANNEMSKLQEIMQPEPGVEFKLEILRSDDN